MSTKADEVIKKRRHEYVRDTFILFAVFAVVVTGIAFLIRHVVKQPDSIVLYSETGEAIGTYSEKDKINVPTKLGYDSAWVSDSGKTYSSVDDALAGGEKSVKQVFTPIEYTVTLYLVGGTQIKDFGFEFHDAQEGHDELGDYLTKTYTVEDESFDLPLAKTNIVAEKHGCKFEFWSSVNYIGKDFPIDGLKATETKTIDTSAAQNVVLYAVWREIPSSVRVIGFDGSLLFAETHTVNTILSEEELTAQVLPHTPTDYMFVGFYSDSALKHPFDFTKALGQEHVTIYTKWHTPEFTLTFKDLNDDVLLETVYMAKDDIVFYDYTSKLTPGKLFDCWLLDNQPFTLTQMPADDIVLYPRLTNIPYTITWYVDDARQESETYYYGDTPVAPSTLNLDKEGNEYYNYEFDKWSPTITEVTGDATYTATYTQVYINYTITFKNDDGTVLSTKTDYNYGDSVIVPSDPSKDADNTYTYAFNGWDSEIATTVTGNAIYTATYTPTYINYTVTFKDEDDSVISTKTDYHYGDTVVLPDNPTKDSDETYDYPFAGWGDEVATVTGNATYTAEYTPTYINYTVTFVDYDDDVISTKTDYHYGDTIVVPDNPTKAPDEMYTYTFGGWDAAVPATVSGNATFTATYNSAVRLYTIVFEDYDGTELYTKADYIYNDNVTIPDDPERAADNTYTYAFAGWSPAVTQVAGDATYTAQYTPTYINYTVTFVDYDDDVISTKTDYHYGDTIVVPDDPERDADNTYTYSFKEWDSEVVPCNGTKTYKATYTATYINYTITFVDYDETTVLLTKADYHYNDTVTLPDDPTKASDAVYSYTFAGWTPAVAKVTGNATYTATYDATEIEYTVTFKDYDGTVLASKSDYHYGDAVVAPDDPERDADNTYTYEFAGWDSTVVACAGNAIYTATYTPTYINYTVTFVDDDDTVISTKTDYHYGDAIEVPTSPTKSADNTYTYEFNGWDSTVVACDGNKTYKATYASTYIEYTISFIDYDDSEIDTDSYHYGDTITPPADPTRAADNTYTYAFNGWTPEIATVTGEATYKATYTPTYINYTVTFVNYNDDVIATKTDYHYGDEVTPPADPTKPSTIDKTYSFDGWDSDVTNVSGNKTYKATYTEHVRQYTYYFYVDSTLVETDTIDYDTEIIAPANPTKDATVKYTYTFNGWYEDLEDNDTKFVTGKHIGGGDVTFYAKFDSTINKYTYTFYNGDAVVSTATVDYETEVDLSEITSPTKTGYTFDGWYDSSNNKLTSNPTIVGNVNYYAHFTANTYVLTYDVNKEGATISAEDTTVTYDQAYGALDIPTKAGYTFVGWYFNSACTGSKIESTDIVDITEDKTIYAKWELTPYYVYAYINGTQVGTFTFDVEHDVTISSYEDANKEDFTNWTDIYDFGGWYEEDLSDSTITTFTSISSYGHAIGNINVYGLVKSKGLEITGSAVTGYSGSASHVVIPRMWNAVNITTIGSNAFVDNNTLETIDAAFITEIQSNAFEFCTELNIDLSNVEVIGSSAFVGCSFTSVDLSSATSIGANAFAYSNVAEITLPIDGLTLGGNVFRNCEITTIHYAGTQQQFEDLVNGTGNANLIWDLVTNS